MIIPGPDPDFTKPLEEGDAVPFGESLDVSVPLITKSLAAGRQVPLNSRLKIASSEVTVSEALHLERCNAASVDIVVFISSSITSIEVVIQGGVDGENFSRISSTILTETGFARFRFQSARYRFLRVYYSASGAFRGVAVLATTLHGSHN